MAMTKIPCVYMMASKKNGTLYVGVTSKIEERVDQHKMRSYPCFTEKYDVVSLVWYEFHDSMYSAISREKKLKKWNRSWKIRLIEEVNPAWKDLLG